MTTTDNELFTELEESLEYEKMCELKVFTQTGGNVPCENVAVYKIGLIKPCSHISTVYLCESCWMRTLVLSLVGGTWRCKSATDSGPCNQSYIVSEAVISVESIK